ncbi:YwqH-like family protein [Bacillus sp. FSL R9-9410]|uniref:YwqH-like family protein n=1 Tax=Bacillus sp. FSL R9-9410 TaxID=2921590 RepID=UPI003100C688
MGIEELNSQKSGLLSSISHQQGQLAELQMKLRRLTSAKGKFVNNLEAIKQNQEQFKSLEINESSWNGQRATTFKETYEQQVISNLGKFIGELGRVQEDIDQAIRRLEREIAACESSILSLSRSVSMVDASIQVEVQKAGK